MGLTDAELGKRCRELLHGKTGNQYRHMKFDVLVNDVDPPKETGPPPAAPGKPPKEEAADEGADAPVVKKVAKKATKKKTTRR